MQLSLRAPALLLALLVGLGCASVSSISESTCEPRDFFVNIEGSGGVASHFRYLLEQELSKRGFNVSPQPAEAAATLVVALSTDVRVSASYSESYSGAGGTSSGGGSGSAYSWLDAWVTVALQSTDGGVIWSEYFEPSIFNIGERLNVADEVIRLVDPKSIEVVARAPLNTVNFIKIDDVLELHNDYRRGEGLVRTIVPFGNPQSHMFEVRINVDPELWTVGESVRLSMPTATAQEVLTVPRDALVLRREGAFVFRIDAESNAEQVGVITGLGAGKLIEIIGDIKAGDRVVIRGAERLSTGAAVAISEDHGGKTSGTAALQ